MRAIIDLVMIGILVVCCWNGYKKGIIMGVAGILCLIVAIYGANLLADTFSMDVVPALKPFANGYTENIISGSDSAVMKRMGWENEKLSEEDLLARYPERKTEFCTQCYRVLGFDAATAERLADRAVQCAEERGCSVRVAVGQILCETVSYAACFILAFLLIIILLTVLGNLTNLSFKLPRYDLVNDIGGTVLGAVTGLMYCVLLVWALKFMGMLIGKETLTATVLGRWLLNWDPLVKYLGL